MLSLSLTDSGCSSLCDSVQCEMWLSGIGLLHYVKMVDVNIDDKERMGICV